ncbi:MAG TPA: hypothetical protein VND64_30190 [Pirellulales bacterium]|nr:hypothetical protein [Pirellulales bacterium]
MNGHSIRRTLAVENRSPPIRQSRPGERRGAGEHLHGGLAVVVLMDRRRMGAPTSIAKPVSSRYSRAAACPAVAPG